jgi:hypothetical protein
MNFEESIYPLTEFLIGKNFNVSVKSHYLVEYSSNSVLIRVVYDNHEHLFYTYVGKKSTSLFELTPLTIKEIFKDYSFKYQTTLTIENLISFFNISGKSILAGNEKVFKKLNEFYEQASKKYTKQLLQYQNIQLADEAWLQKDYANFIKSIDKTEKTLLPESYLKKYKIAIAKLQKRTNKE